MESADLAAVENHEIAISSGRHSWWRLNKGGVRDQRKPLLIPKQQRRQPG